MAHKKAGSSSANGRDSNAQRLGVKLYGGQFAKVGSIIVRQRGSQFRAGRNTSVGKDDSIFTTKEGTVKFINKKVKKYTGKIEAIKIITVIAK